MSGAANLRSCPPPSSIWFLLLLCQRIQASFMYTDSLVGRPWSGWVVIRLKTSCLLHLQICVRNNPWGHSWTLSGKRQHLTGSPLFGKQQLAKLSSTIRKQQHYIFLKKWRLCGRPRKLCKDSWASRCSASNEAFTDLAIFQPHASQVPLHYPGFHFSTYKLFLHAWILRMTLTGAEDDFAIVNVPDVN